MGRGKTLTYIAIPIVALAVLLFAIVRYGGAVVTGDFPPIEDVSIQWTTLRPGEIELQVINGGPDPVHIAQVIVDDAYWKFEMSPSNQTLGRLEKGRITIPYPWVDGETHAVRLISENGVTFDSEIAVAVESPQPSQRSFLVFAILGIVIGVVPVGLGLLWYPALRAITPATMRFFLSLTVGLLVFLGLDTMEEGLEIANSLPGPMQGTSLLIGVALMVFFALFTVAKASEGKPGRSREATLAFLVALGIGLHNVGEGLAVGSAYVLGEVSVGASLILGFTLHNVTEGLAIVAPLAKTKTTLARFLALGAIAGLPTIAGTLIGGFTYSNLWALVFFGVAAGAIFQVVFAISYAPVMKSEKGEIATPENFLGFLCGLAVMYGTGLLVSA